MALDSGVRGLARTALKTDSATALVGPSVEQRRLDYSGTAYFGSLDGLRAFSVLAVLWHHAVVPSSAIPLSGRGFLGVDMFFVLSGYLITTILLREQDRNNDISLKRFYIRRSLRIFPLYYAIIFGCLAVGLVSEGSNFTAIRESAPSLLLYMTNWFPTISLLAVSWSLATEEQFYLVWPPLQKFLGKAALVPVLLFIAANQLVNFGVLFSQQRPDSEILQVTFTPICLGVVLAYVLHYRFTAVWSVFGHRFAAPGFGILLVVVMSLPSETGSLVGAHRLSIHLVMTALLASLVVREDHVLARVLKNRLLVRVGVVSYGMYLLHMFVIHFALQLMERTGLSAVPLSLFVVVTVATYVAAELSFKFFESPMLRLKPKTH